MSIFKNIFKKKEYISLRSPKYVIVRTFPLNYLKPDNIDNRFVSSENEKEYEELLFLDEDLIKSRSLSADNILYHPYTINCLEIEQQPPYSYYTDSECKAKNILPVQQIGGLGIVSRCDEIRTKPLLRPGHQTYISSKMKLVTDPSIRMANSDFLRSYDRDILNYCYSMYGGIHQKGLVAEMFPGGKRFDIDINLNIIPSLGDHDHGKPILQGKIFVEDIKNLQQNREFKVFYWINSNIINTVYMMKISPIFMTK